MFERLDCLVSSIGLKARMCCEFGLSALANGAFSGPNQTLGLQAHLPWEHDGFEVVNGKQPCNSELSDSGERKLEEEHQA